MSHSRKGLSGNKDKSIYDSLEVQILADPASELGHSYSFNHLRRFSSSSHANTFVVAVVVVV